MEEIFVDVETSGKLCGAGHVVEAAAVVLNDGLEETESFETLANPGEEAILAAEPEALLVSRIAPETIRSAPPASQAAEAFRRFLARHPLARIHAFWNEFDRGFLAKPPWGIGAEAWGECVMRAAAGIMKQAGVLLRRENGRLKWPSLDEARRFFMIPQADGERHRALPDARTASRIYAAVLRQRADEDTADEALYFIDMGL